MERARILIVDDEPAMLVNCERFLSREGYDCVTLRDPTRVRAVLDEVRPDVLLLDLRMPGVDGMTVLTVALADDPALPVVIMTAHASVNSAVEAIREGAFDYLEKPFSADQLVVSVNRAVRHRGLAVENRTLREQVDRGLSNTIIGSSKAITQLLHMALKVAAADSNVLISGESGTGKELIARCIHANSSRKDRPFTPVDCAAMPEGLLESELFGYEPGAFTGAVRRRRGLLDEAAGGTVFLDEFTELSAALQSKLLRVLEERKVRRLVGSALIDIDIRVLAATNVDLDEAVALGSFREDLYYRLNVVPLHLPPLREREGDVILLAQQFLARYSAAQEWDPPKVSPDVWEALERYPWPGNVRELKNLAERLVVLHEGDSITLSDLPEAFRTDWATLTRVDDGELLPYPEARLQALQEFRKRYARTLLGRCGGNVSRAARTAGVSRRTVYRWLDELEAEPPANQT
jgi:DNA-binding NtrC family response regulator